MNLRLLIKTLATDSFVVSVSKIDLSMTAPRGRERERDMIDCF